ncbi:PAS domain S-box protein [Cohnella faecalis]|uniref:Circadian input-output histidine kinase CikA n=2 Tax=Cohnella faecalis TaxID=2315694 RepID=A0A398CRN5_9BACL|nr:PAS domain S-box protein [Cohnella faecalis]
MLAFLAIICLFCMKMTLTTWEEAMFRSLRFKLIVVLLALHGVSFSLMAYFNYQMSTKKLTDEMERNMKGNLTTAARNLDDWLNLRQTEGSLLARSDNIRTGTTEDKLAYLRQLTSRTMEYVRIGIGDRTGKMRLTDGSTIEMNGMFAYRAALNGVSNIADPLKKSKPDEPNLLWTFVPIFDLSRQVSGVLGLALDSDAALKQHLYFDSFDYKDFTITLLDRSTTLLYHSNEPDLIGYNYHANTPNSNALFDLIQKQNYGHGDQFIRGRVQKVYFAHVPNTNWIITYSVNRAEFMHPLRSSLSWTLALVALTELLLGILLFVASDVIMMKRLKRILSQTEKVASGDLQLSPLPTGSRDELGAISVSVNRMTENLRDLFEPFNTFIKHNDFAMLVVDTRFVITSFNDRAVQLLGYSAAEVIGTRSLLRWHDPDQIKERARSYSEKLGTHVPNDENALFVLSQRGYLPEWEWIWINRDGARIPVSLNTSIMKNSDGSTKGYVVIARDVTEIKSAADTNVRLLEILESAHDMIASFDFRGRIFYLNQQGRKFMDILELNEHTELLSRYMNVTTTFQFANGLKSARDKGFWQGEVEMVRADGLSFMTSMIVVAHAPKDGGEPFFSTIVRDISAQKEIEREIVHAKHAADEANEAKSSFLARMSHEIRTPLSGIIGLTQLLRRSELSELQHEYLEQIGLSSQSLLQMLNEVLDFSKLEADKLSIEKVPFLPEESLQRLTATFAVLLGSNPVDFIVNVDPKLPAAWIGDPSRLEQVLLNLGSNAVKFTKQGVIELRIEPAPFTQDSGNNEEEIRVRFTVSDTGIGMTGEQITRLFQPFVQADDKTSRKYGGTGLGLVICKALIENMGGTISVHSEYGAGSSFPSTFLLACPKAVRLRKRRLPSRSGSKCSCSRTTPECSNIGAACWNRSDAKSQRPSVGEIPSPCWRAGLGTSCLSIWKPEICTEKKRGSSGNGSRIREACASCRSRRSRGATRCFACRNH